MISVVYLAMQVRQSNRHAEASADVAWMDGWNQVLNGWVGDDATIETLQAGFEDFDSLPRVQQARFQMRVGAMVNHWVLADQLKNNPNGAWLLARVKENPSEVPMFTELFPWWASGQEPTDVSRPMR